MMERMVKTMITLFSLEQYLNANKKSLFDGIALPVSPLLDKDTLTDKILLQCGEFESLYANAEFMAFATRNFFKTHLRTFDKWVKALEVEYEPLENYNRTETETYGADYNNVAEVHTTVDGLKRTTETSETITRETVQGEVIRTSYDGEITETNHQGKVTTTVTPPDTQTVNEYGEPFNYVTNTTPEEILRSHTVTKISDSVNPTNATTTVVQEDPTDDDVRKISGDSTKPSVETVDGNSSKPTTETTKGSTLEPKTIETGHVPGQEDETTITRNPRELHAFGNIGTMTSQQMLQSELDLQIFNLYEKIATMYETEMVIPVYA